MLSYLLFVVSMVGNSGFVSQQSKDELMETGGTTGGLVVTMGPVMNMHVADVRVIPGGSAMPTIAPKGSMFESFSKSRLYAVRYDR
jgi:hypothetical protein